MKTQVVAHCAANLDGLATAILLAIVFDDAVVEHIKTPGIGLGRHAEFAFGYFQAAGDERGAVGAEAIGFSTGGIGDAQFPDAEQWMPGTRRLGRRVGNLR